MSLLNCFAQWIHHHCCSTQPRPPKIDRFRKPLVNLLLALSLALAGLGRTPGPAYAATWTVLSTSDSGAGSLRQIIANAASGDTITFSLTTPAVITLASEITINKSLTLVGPGAALLAIDGAGATRIFKITAGTFRISQVTLQNGYSKGQDASYQTPGTYNGAGGAIYIGTGAGLITTNVVFANNAAAGGSGGNAGGPGGFNGGAGGGAGGAPLRNGLFGGGGGGDYAGFGAGSGGFGGGGGGSSVKSGGSGWLGGNGGSGSNVTGYSGGGGGAGMGGAIFIDTGGSLGLRSTAFNNNQVQGGSGGSAAPLSEISFGGGGGGGGAGLGSAIFNNGSLCIDTGVTFNANTKTGGSPGAGQCGDWGYSCPSAAGAGQALDTATGVYDLSQDNSCTILYFAPTDLTFTPSSLDEGQPLGTLAGSFTSTDPDAGDTSFTYTLVSGTGSTDNALFSISGSTLITNAILNYETKSTYSFRVRTTDPHNLFYEKSFSLSINNINLSPTNITLSNPSLAEGQPIGTNIGSFTTTDGDTGESFTYSLVTPGGTCSGVDNHAFAISGNTLQTAAIFDFETKASYTVCVRTTDNGTPTLSYDKQFTINVTNINEAPTQITLSNNSIEENRLSGTAVGSFTTTDGDTGESFTYSLVTPGGTCSSVDNHAFAISGNTLQTAAMFDFETKASYTVCVRTTDNGTPTLSYDKQFTINVTNINEAPTSISLSNGSLAENLPVSTPIGTFSSSDPDSNEAFTYSLVDPGGTCSGADNSSFSISANTLQSAAMFDFETKNSYTICIRTTDSGTPGLTYDKQFSIRITDVNEAPTQITLSNNTVNENQPTGAAVGSFTTTDPDSAETFTYTLVNPGGACSGADNALFSISGSALQTAEIFDFEIQKAYTICVRVTDSGSPSLSFDQPFTIHITNVNENPVLDYPLSDQNFLAGIEFTFSFPANSFRDPDGDPLLYSADLSSGSELPAWLTFDPATRAFSGIAPKAQTLQIRVMAEDGLGGSVIASFMLNITSQPGNHNPVQAKPIPNAHASVGVTFNFTVAGDTFVDRDQDVLSYLAELSSSAALPAWLSFDPATRTFSGKPTAADEGVQIIRITALDGKGGEASATFYLGVNRNVPPALVHIIPDQAAGRGKPWTFQFAPDAFTDADSDPLSYSADLSDGSALPGWLTFNPATRTFTGTPPVTGMPRYTYSIRVTASDGVLGHSASDSFLFGPWLTQDPDHNLPTGSRVMIQDAPGAGPTLTPPAVKRLNSTVDLQVIYEIDPITDLPNSGMRVCFDTGPAEGLTTGGNLSRLVIGSSHQGDPWKLLPTFRGSTNNQICANANQFSLFDLFLKSSGGGGTNGNPNPAQLPATGFAPGKVTQLPAQPAERAYLAFDEVSLEIPSLSLKTSVVGVPFNQGTWDVSWLWNQIGWLEGSAFPGWDGNSVLTGHVYNSNGKPGPFVDISDLAWGSQVIVHAFGETYFYEVRTVEDQVAPNHVEAIQHKEQPWLTLITCKGFNQKNNTYQWRTVVRAVLVKTVH